MTKIALCTEILYPLFGVERRVYEMAKRLPKYGFDVDVYTSSFQKDLIDINIKQISYPTITRPPKRSYAQCTNFSFNLFKKLMKDKYDIIDANGHLSLIPCSMAGIARKKPVVATIHDLYLNEWNKMYNGFGAFFGLPFEMMFCKMPYTKIITLNNSIKSKMTDILGMNREKIEIIPSGIDVKKIDSIKAKKEKNRIIYVGRLVPQKNVDMLIRAFSTLEAESEMVILGDGSEYQKLKKMADSSKIKFLGRLGSYEDTIREIKKSSILVLPSRRENFGIVPLEAMRCGTAVISTNTEGPRDYIRSGENGFLTGIGGEKELVEKIDLLLNDKKMLERIKRNGRKTAEEYDWDMIIKKIADVYNEIIEKRSH